MKIVNIVFGSLFVLSAILQYNDPDPFLWIVIYLYAGMICFLGYFGKLTKRTLVIGMVLFAFYAATLIPGFYTWLTGGNQGEIFGEMSANRMYVEETREFLGLVICLVIFGFNFYKIQKG